MALTTKFKNVNNQIQAVQKIKSHRSRYLFYPHSHPHQSIHCCCCWSFDANDTHFTRLAHIHHVKYRHIVWLWFNATPVQRKSEGSNCLYSEAGGLELKNDKFCGRFVHQIAINHPPDLLLQPWIGQCDPHKFSAVNSLYSVGIGQQFVDDAFSLGCCCTTISSTASRSSEHCWFCIFDLHFGIVFEIAIEMKKSHWMWLNYLFKFLMWLVSCIC